MFVHSTHMKNSCMQSWLLLRGSKLNSWNLCRQFANIIFKVHVNQTRMRFHAFLELGFVVLCLNFEVMPCKNAQLILEHINQISSPSPFSQSFRLVVILSHILSHFLWFSSFFLPVQLDICGSVSGSGRDGGVSKSLCLPALLLC